MTSVYTEWHVKVDVFFLPKQKLGPSDLNSLENLKKPFANSCVCIIYDTGVTQQCNNPCMKFEAQRTDIIIIYIYDKFRM